MLSLRCGRVLSLRCGWVLYCGRVLYGGPVLHRLWIRHGGRVRQGGRVLNGGPVLCGAEQIRGDRRGRHQHEEGGQAGRGGQRDPDATAVAGRDRLSAPGPGAVGRRRQDAVAAGITQTAPPPDSGGRIGCKMQHGDLPASDRRAPRPRYRAGSAGGR
jgi:hypothetical protein